MKKTLKAPVQIIIIILILIVAFIVMKKLIGEKSSYSKRQPPVPVPMVRVMDINTADFNTIIKGEGNVQPKDQIWLFSQVSGKVLFTSPAMVNGGQFKKNEILVRVDPVDYELAATLAESKVKDAESKLSQAIMESEAAKEEWRLLHASGTIPPLVAKEPQLIAAKAKLEAEKADLKKASLNLDKTVIRAPFSGMVTESRVTVGGNVNSGLQLGTLFSTEAVEIVVPMEDEELFWLNVPGFTPGKGPGSLAVVKARFGGRDMSWEGRVVRAQGTLDEKSRMVNIVVRVLNPYLKKPPLAIGLFVQVEIQGRSIENACVIPRRALHDDNQVWIANSRKLHFKKVEVARIQGEKVIVKSGLNNGDRLITSPLHVVSENMKLKVIEGTKLAKVKDKDLTYILKPPEEILNDLTKKIKISDKIAAKIKPTILYRWKEQKRLGKKYGPKGPKGIKTMLKKLRDLGDETNEKLGKHLTEEQLKGYERFQKDLDKKRRAATRFSFK